MKQELPWIIRKPLRYLIHQALIVLAKAKTREQKDIEEQKADIFLDMFDGVFGGWYAQLTPEKAREALAKVPEIKL